MSATTYHCCVDLSAIIKGSSHALLALRTFDAFWREASNEAIVTEAVIKRAKGMEAWPLCDHHTATGQCKGHPK